MPLSLNNTISPIKNAKILCFFIIQCLNVANSFLFQWIMCQGFEFASFFYDLKNTKSSTCFGKNFPVGSKIKLFYETFCSNLYFSECLLFFYAFEKPVYHFTISYFISLYLSINWPKIELCYILNR